jgi:hypothetical protein
LDEVNLVGRQMKQQTAANRGKGASRHAREERGPRDRRSNLQLRRRGADAERERANNGERLLNSLPFSRRAGNAKAVANSASQSGLNFARP